MDFDFYRNFIVVAETGNISAAAKRLNLVQPALSAQIKTLEKYYQTQLFKTGRGKRHIELTEAGEAFLLQAKLLCATEDNLNLNMQAFSKQTNGTLRFSVSHVRSEYFLEHYLIPFAKVHPLITFQFHDATVAQQLQQLAQGQIDFAFANAPLPHSEEITALTVNTEHFYAFYNKELPAPWQSTQALHPADLEGISLCCNYGSYGLLRSVCQSYNVQPKVAFIATTASNALTFAASGLGVAVVAALPQDPIPDHMERLLIKDAKLTFSLSLYWSNKNKLSPAAELFLSFFQEQNNKRP